MVNQKKPRMEKLTGESAKAIADKVIGENVIPKKIPGMHNTEGQERALVGALSSALLTATEMPLHTLQPVVADMAKQLVALGVRQTGHIDQDAIHVPAWITDGVKQKSMQLPEQPAHTEAEPIVARTAEAPPMPKKIAKHARARRR